MIVISKLCLCCSKKWLEIRMLVLSCIPWDFEGNSPLASWYLFSNITMCLRKVTNTRGILIFVRFRLTVGCLSFYLKRKMLKKMSLAVVIWSPARAQALTVEYYLGYLQMATDINPLPNTHKNLLTDKNRSGDMNNNADNTSPGENICKNLGWVTILSWVVYSLFVLWTISHLLLQQILEELTKVCLWWYYWDVLHILLGKICV